jgi:glycosyltransferase involved in cell wall biosynthesis
VAKILWYGDACSNTGFGRVTHSVLEELHKEHEVHVIGINYNGDPHDYPYPIYPAANVHVQDRFGIPRLPEIVNKVKPDVIIALNDVWVVNQVWERIQFLRDTVKFKFLAYIPIDSQSYVPDMFKHLPNWDLAVTFTIPCANRILEHKVAAPRLGVLPHGVSLDKFFPMNRDQARDELGLPKDKFIVFNGNRNQPRKRIDLTIKAFADFAVDKPDTMLYLNMGSKDLGWDIKSLFSHEMSRRGLDPKHRLAMTTPNEINYMAAPPDELLNKVYNAVDVGINTADGEGWGLVSFEHGACGVPQIVPNHTACADIWGGAGLLTDIATWVRDKDLGVERGLISTDHLSKQLTELYADKDLCEEIGQKCFEVTQKPDYRWENVSAGFSAAIQELTK